MAGEPHIVHVGTYILCIGQHDRTLPETEVIDAVGAFGYSEEALAVGTFHTHHQHILAVPLYGAGIESGVDADSLHKAGIGGRIEIIAPGRRHHLGCYHGVLVSAIHTIAFNGAVASLYQRLISAQDESLAVFKEVHKLFHLRHSGCKKYFRIIIKFHK